MDFFKNCRTNVQICNNINDIAFSVHEAERHDRERRSKLQDVVAQLRDKGTLCTSARHQLWVFGAGDDALPEISADMTRDFRLLEQGALATGSRSGSSDGRRLPDILLEAIEGAISFKLTKICGVLRVGSWKWLFFSRESANTDNEGVLLRLNLKFTNSGSLYATTVAEHTTIAPVDISGQSGETNVILAPSGAAARTIATEAGDSRGQMSGAVWQAMAAQSMSTEGITIPDDAEWLPVCLRSNSNAEECIMWPSHLCMTSAAAATKWRQEPVGGEFCDHRPTPPDYCFGFKNPLAFAEEWFKSAGDREKAALLNASQAGANVTDDASALPTASTAYADGSVSTSPPFVHRVGDLQAAMNGIYPTPEDNLIGTQPSQQQSSDTAPSTAQPDPNNLGGELLPTGDDLQVRRQTSSSEPLTFQPDNDDLFGVMGGEMDLGGGEVGDADFEFFDEEDTEGSPHQNEDIAMLGGEQSAAQDEGIEQNHHVDGDLNSAGIISDIQSAKTDATQEVQASAKTVAVDRDATVTADRDHDTAMKVIDQRMSPSPEKPLSPFGIKERLLPPPIPASAKVAADDSTTSTHRRISTFDPLSFKEGLDIGGKYSAAFGPDTDPNGDNNGQPGSIDISLPPRRKKFRFKRAQGRDSDISSDDSESEEDSSKSISSVSDEDLPAKLPWYSRKRKRSDLDPAVAEGEFGRIWQQQEPENITPEVTDEQMLVVLDRLLDPKLYLTPAFFSHGTNLTEFDSESRANGDGCVAGLPSVEKLPYLTELDLVCIAQLVSEQAASCLGGISKALDNLGFEQNTRSKAAASTLQAVAERLLGHLIPDCTTCDISKLALTRDPATRAVPSTAARLGHPRPPPQRSDNINSGPDLACITPPHLRVRRGNDTYEMLPPALEFWETLSLSPIGGPKNVRAFCVFPFSEDLQRLADTFMGELGSAYESCRLGSHVHVRNAHENDSLDDFENGLAPVKLSDNRDLTPEAALQAYSAACTDLGSFLSNIGHLETERERTFVIYMVDPFPHEVRARQHMCASFWQLYKAYRDNIPRTRRSHQRSDVVLQFVPVELLASADTLVSLDAKQLGALAKEVYDRCPPSPARNQEITSALPNYIAPFVELATPPPRRIGFQLSADPPSDLLHEQSSLHLAYATSQDGQWIVAAWTDGTGRYQSSASFCLRGRSFGEAAEDIWRRTEDIIAAREVNWRIFILTTGDIEESIWLYWRKLIERPRKQPYVVTLLTAQLDPDLKLTPPTPPEDAMSSGTGAGAGFLTPVTTPQASSMTVSPDAGSHNAPPTPAPSDMSTAAPADCDPEAHLIDVTDESWAILFSPACTTVSTASDSAVASGALFKRSEAGLESNDSETYLPCFGLSLLWTVKIGPNGNVDELSVKHAEGTLREVLKMNRNLNALTKAKALDWHGSALEGTVMPVHLAGALMGAEALNGYLL